MFQTSGAERYDDLCSPVASWRRTRYAPSKRASSTRRTPTATKDQALPALGSPHPVRTRILFALGLIAILGTAVAARLSSPTSEPSHAVTWQETPWDLPLDNWGQGRVWRATSSDGGELRLFARTKTGFCNCFNGIADDTEIDRIGDVDLHGDSFTPAAPGEPTSIGDLPGRKRQFATTHRWSGTRHVLSIVAATGCKAVVATLVSDRPISSGQEATAVALLTGPPFRRWAGNQ